MAESWTRAIRVTIGAPEELGLSWVGLRATFSVERDRSSDPNQATIRLYNLSSEARETCALGDRVVTLEAGYAGGPILPLFRGFVMRATSDHARGEWETTLEAEDRATLAAAEDDVITLSRGPGVTALQLLQDLLETVGASTRIVASTEAGGRAFLYGYSIHQPVRRAVRQVAEAAGFEVSVQNGVVVCLPVDGHSMTPVQLVAMRTGLVGRPQRALIETTHRRGGRRRERPGVTFRCLLNAAYEPTDRVRLESATATGDYVVQSVRYSGDTHGQDWYAEVEAVDEAEMGE